MSFAAVARQLDTKLLNTYSYPWPYFADAPSAPPNLTGNAITAYYLNFGYYNGSNSSLYNTAPYATGTTYDTWAYSYEKDGVDQLSLSNASFDQQTDGLDNNNDGVVDDINERDTIPPYSYSLRGLQVKIRVYEPSTRQVRQATVGTDFITE